jgi:hypothetical protein
MNKFLPYLRDLNEFQACFLYSNYAMPITMSTTKCVGYTPINIFLDFPNSM